MRYRLKRVSGDEWIYYTLVTEMHPVLWILGSIQTEKDKGVNKREYELLFFHEIPKNVFKEVIDVMEDSYLE